MSGILYSLGVLLKELVFLVSYVKNNAFPQPLSAADEKKYLRLMAQGDSHARNMLIEHNLRLVAHIVKKFENTGEDSEDLISIGTIGLIKGIESFSEGKGTKLATYAARCIENEILMHLRALKKTKKDVSLHDPIGQDKEGNEISLIDVLKSESEDVVNTIQLNMELEKVKEYIDVLDEREKEVIVGRFGLDLQKEKQLTKHDDMVRFELMDKFGYYVTESSEHNAEYHPYFIKRNYPELIEKFNIPLDEYPRRCVEQMERWGKMRDEMVNNTQLTHTRSHEYGSRIIEAIETNNPFKFGGNLLNTGRLISNLPEKAVVEVSCLADRSGITPCYVGDIPEQLAALNRTNINTQLLTIEAAATGKREHIYQAAMLDPHTAAELSMGDIIAMCDDLIAAHGDWIPKFDTSKTISFA